MGQCRLKSLSRRGTPMSLLRALYAFYLEHGYCGELDSDVDDSAGVDGVRRVWGFDPPDAGAREATGPGSGVR